MSQFKAIRCGSSNPTPYLVKQQDLFTECGEGSFVIDIGCGNGRNSEYLKQLGMHVMSLDGLGDYGIKWAAGGLLVKRYPLNRVRRLLSYVIIFLCL